MMAGTETDESIRRPCNDCHAKRTAEQFGLKAPRSPIGLDGWPLAQGGRAKIALVALRTPAG